MSRDGQRILLLDTHVFIWYVENDAKRFSRRIEPLIEKAAQRGNVRIAAISVWEIAQLEAAGRIHVSVDLRSWIARALSFPGVHLEPLTPAIAIESTRLPGFSHKDPVDRMLAATARQLGASLVTCDERIIEFGRSGPLSVIDARP